MQLTRSLYALLLFGFLGDLERAGATPSTQWITVAELVARLALPIWIGVAAAIRDRRDKQDKSGATKGTELASFWRFVIAIVAALAAFPHWESSCEIACNRASHHCCS